MTCLNDFTNVKNALKGARKENIVPLHKFVFEAEGDRNNRQRLRSFRGFDFDENDGKYRAKCEYISKELSINDLTSVCIILGLDYNEEDVKLHIFRNLQKGRLLQNAQNDDDDASEIEDDDDERGNLEDTVVPHSRDEGDEVNDDDDEDSNDDEEDEMATMASGSTRRVGRRRHDVARRETERRPQSARFGLSFHDVVDTLTTYDGSNTIAVDTWVKEFEDTAAMFYWDELQMMVFAKKSLKGLARLFVAGCRELTTWKRLKKALISEFGVEVNGRAVHKRLTERCMKREETVVEYFYKMKEIANGGNVSDDDLIQYVIDGIKDVNANKQMLYGANNLDGFKQKLRDYERFTTKHSGSNERRHADNKIMPRPMLPSRPKYNNVTTNNSNRCYNCGENGHVSANCTNRERGKKCFRCNQFGHVSKECIVPNNNNGDRQEIRYLNVYKDVMTKKVEISSKTITALIDTGAMVNVMKESTSEKLSLKTLEPTNMSLKGFGGANRDIRPRGCTKTDVLIDNNTYPLTFYVVPDECVSDDVIIGAQIIDEAEMVISSDGIRVEKKQVAAVMRISTQMSDEDTYDIGETASQEVKNAVTKLVAEYKPLQNKFTEVTMKIVLKDETPVYSGVRRLPLSQHAIVDEQIDKWLKEGIIEESSSEFCSPVVLAPKRDGSQRLCIDFRKINKVIIRDRFPLPLLEDQLDRLKEARVFSTIDLKNGFFHVPVEKESRKYTAFGTHSGQYQFCRVPFGLSNSPAVFQRFVNSIFRELTRRGIAHPYVDDVIIPGKDEEDALKNLETVLRVASNYGLNLNLKKCQFMKRRIEFLGYIIENQQIMPNPSTIEAVVNFPMPRTLKQVESFLGLASYFRKFIPNFARLAKPLSDLRRKDVKFKMGEEQIKSVEMLKEKLSSRPVLKIFHPKHETELHTDASADGYGAILLQKSPGDNKLHPCYFMSKKTTDLQRKYTSYELEILAVVEALKKFRVYLLGIKFKVVTDCNAFVKTMEKKDLCTRVSRWLLLLQEYEYVIEHRQGTRMKHVDALSRCNIMMIEENNLVERMAKAQHEDDELKTIFELLKTRENYNDYYEKAGVMYKEVNGVELMVVPNNMQHGIIKQAHEKGHFALSKTKQLLQDEYFIPKMDEKIQRTINSCIRCLLINRKRGKQEGMLHPLPREGIPLYTYHVDHLGPLESSHKGYKYIFAVTDAFTKFCWLYPTKTTTSKEVITKLRLQSTTFGSPEIIISDRGTAFTAEEFQDYCREENIQHHSITTGLPRANGQIERLNSTIINVLAKLSAEDPTKWYKFVDQVQQIINSTFHRSIKRTPFELMIGKPMKSKIDMQIRQALEEEVVKTYDESREEIRRAAKREIQKVQEENRHNYNLRRKQATVYAIDDLVAVKRTQFGPNLKLKAKYLGPYRVTAVKANNTYDVRRVTETEGPKATTTCAEFMKKWPVGDPFEA